MEIEPQPLREKQVNDYSRAYVYQISKEVFMVEQSIKFEGQLLAVYYTTLEEALLIFDQISDEHSIVECVVRSRTRADSQQRHLEQPQPPPQASESTKK